MPHKYLLAYDLSMIGIKTSILTSYETPDPIPR
jgi:hypothetical protein